MPNCKIYNQKGVRLDIKCLYDFLADNSPARLIDKVVNALDISKILDSYSNEGRPSYHPLMMLKILFYSYYLGIHSCRKMYNAVINRIDFIFLAANQVPNYRTINRFRTRHAEHIPDLFCQIVSMCVKLQMVDFKELAIDGQKIKANANFRKSKNLALLVKSLERVRRKIIKITNENIDSTGSLSDKASKRLEKLKHKEVLLCNLKKVLEELDKDGFINMTDEDAKVMKHKDGRSMPSYNHQAAVDGKFGVTCAIVTSDKIDTPPDLDVLKNASEENTGSKHENVMADSAYCDFDVLEKASKNKEQNILVKDKLMHESEANEKDDKIYNKDKFTFNEKGDLICPEGDLMEISHTFNKNKRTKIQYIGTACELCPNRNLCTKGIKRTVVFDSKEEYKYEMRRKLKDKKNKERYYRRGAIVEPSFGNDQRNYKWIQHHLRGLFNATLEFALIRIGANLRKMFKYRFNEFLSTYT